MLVLGLVLAWVRPVAAGVPEKVWETRVLRPAPQGYPSRIVRNVRTLADGSLMALGQDGAAASALRYSVSGQLVSAVTVPGARGVPSAIDAFGNFIVTTVFDRSSGVSVMRFAADTAVPLWEAPFVVDAPPGGFSEPLAIVLDPNGDVFLAASSGVPGAYSAAVYKLDGLTGRPIWGPTAVDETDADPVLLRVGGGRVFLAMTQRDPVTYRRLAIAQLDGATGAIRWGPVGFGRTFTDSLVDAAVDGNGDVIVTGRYGGITGTWKLGGSSGAVIWGPNLESASTPRSVTCDTRGDVVIAVEGSSGNVVKYDGTSGGRRWSAVFPAAFSSDARVRVDAAGTVFVSTLISRAGMYPTDIGTAAFDGNTGALRWGPVEMGAPENYYDELGALELDSTGAVVVAGSVNGGAAMVLHAYDGATGTTAWGPALFWGGANGSDVPSSADTDAAGDVFVAADSWGGDPTATKVHGRSGRILWGPIALGLSGIGRTHPTIRATALGDAVLARWNGPGSSVLMLGGLDGAVRWSRSFADVFFPLAIPDGAGNVFVVGLAAGTNLVAWKLAAATGATLWGPANFGPNFIGSPEDGAVSPGGDLVLTGETVSAMQVVRIGGASGSLVWGPTAVTSGAGWIDRAIRIRLDASANVVVSGTSSAGSASLQTVTKLNGATGAVLWGPWTSAGFGLDGGNSDMVLDAAGNAVVTGGGTFKVDASTGAALWSSAAVAQFVRLGGDGNVVLAASSFDDALFDYVLTLQKLDAATGLPVWAPFRRPHAWSAAALVSVEGDPLFVGGTTDLEKATLVGRVSDGLTIAPEATTPRVALCGHAYAYALQAVNGTPPLHWELLLGALPSGLTLGSDGLLSGTSTDVGEFPVVVRITDGAGGAAIREITVRVLAATSVATIQVASSPACQGPDRVLSVAGSFDAYEWLPGGETSPTIVVRPDRRTTYGVTVRSGSCEARGEVTLEPNAAPPAPSLVAPDRALEGATGLVASATERIGSVYSWSISNGTIDSGQGTPKIHFTAGTSGPLLLSVSEIDATGCLHPEATRRLMVVSSAEGLLFNAVPPCRILDTRLIGPITLALNFGFGVSLAGACGIPFTAASVVANVTVVDPVGAGDLRLAAGRPSFAPDVSLLSFQSGHTRAVSSIVSLPTDGSDVVTLWGSGSPTVHVVLDVSGYFQ